MFAVERIDDTNVDIFLPLIPRVLQEWGSDERGWRFYGIVMDSTASGIVALSESADICRLRYLYLLSECRGLGVIEKALSAILFELYEQGFSRLTADYIPSEYPTIDSLLKSLSFTIQPTDRAYFRFQVKDVLGCKASTYAPQGVMRFKLLPEYQKETMYRMIRSHGYDIDQILGSDVGEIGRLSFMEYSLVYMERDNPVGILMVQDMSEAKLPEGGTAFGKIYPEPSSATIALIYIGSTQMKAPLYLLSALCRNVLTNFQDNEILTGYFPMGHLAKLLEGTLGVRGNHEVSAVINLSGLEQYYLEGNDDLNVL